MMRKKIIIICLAVITACLSLLFMDEANLKKPDEEKKGLSIALSNAEPLTPWKTAQINSFQEAARKQGISLIYEPPVEETVRWQVQNIRKLLEAGLDYLILIPREETGYDNILTEAKERGVTVILAEQMVKMDPIYNPEEYYISYIAPDYFHEGKLCADILSDYFGKKIGHILVIQGERRSFMDWERHMGFMHGVRMQSNLYVSKRITSDGDRLAAQKAVEQLLAEHTIDFNAVFAPTDEDGLGVLQALKLAGAKPGKNIVIVSIEGIQDVLKAIIAEEYLATVKSDTDYGKAVFDLIEKCENNEPVPRHITTKNQIYTIKNAEDVFENAY